MNPFFDPQANSEDTVSKRLYAPATARNRDFILDVLKAHHPGHGTLLEIASGSGEHAAHMAHHFDGAHWQPSDIEPEKINSIDAWRADSGTDALLPAIRFDAVADDMAALDFPAPLTAVMAVNLIHIAPWAVAEALIAKAASTLETDGVVFLYGPYKRNGVHTSPSNESFDQSLKSRDARWGVRDLEAVTDLACAAGFKEPTIVEMPANNLSVIFRKN